MLTGYPLSCTLGRSVLGIGSGVARFLMIAEYATYRYLRCAVNVIETVLTKCIFLMKDSKLGAKNMNKTCLKIVRKALT